jgi:diaminopimelate epimerase
MDIGNKEESFNGYSCNKYIGDCCGNSFVILDCRNDDLSKEFKSRFASENIAKYNVDSALYLEKSRKFDIFMEIFEKDGSESESCGNGTILIAYLLGLNEGIVEMKDNAAKITGDSERQGISMSMKFAGLKKIEGKDDCVFVKMGEPHIVCLVDDVNNFDLIKRGEEFQKDYPEGVNVDAIQKVNDHSYLIRTYERGVFSETKSCGTGSLSSYIAVSYFVENLHKDPIEFKSAGGSHWVSNNNGDLLKLETSKKFCKIKEI